MAICLDSHNINSVHTVAIFFVSKEGLDSPNMQRVEIYFLHNMTKIEKQAAEKELNPFSHVPGLANFAEVELYMYLPAWKLTTWEGEGTLRELNAALSLDIGA